MLLIHLDLPGPALAQLDWPLPAIVAGQGVTLPPDVQFGEAPLPLGADGIADKGWGPVLKLLTDPARVVAGATAVSIRATTSLLFGVACADKSRARRSRPADGGGSNAGHPSRDSRAAMLAFPGCKRSDP